MSRVLLTGGAGFIGSHVADRLLVDGHEVVAVDNLSTGSRENLSAALTAAGTFTLEEVDITSGDLGDVVATARPDVVLHLAAQMDVRRSVADPVFDATVNVLGTVNLLEASRRAGVGKFVLASSGGTIYGEPKAAALPLTEEYQGHPGSPYGASKRAVEEYLYTFDALYGLRWTSLALGNVYGPRQDPAGEAGVVSIFGSRMLAGKRVTIYGDGEQTRDFVYVLDVVEAFVRAMAAADGRRLNIGTGQETSVNQLHGELASIVAAGDPTQDPPQDPRQNPPQYEAQRPGELRRLALDSRAAEESLGWHPRTSLHEGLGATVSWLRG